MLVINYYFARDGKAFESEADKKSYERTRRLDQFSRCVVKIWQKASSPKHEIPLDKLTVFRGGYLAKGVFRGRDFFIEDEAKDYEQFSYEAQNAWMDYLKYAMPEDLLSYYDEMYLSELPSYGWTMWGTDKPLPGTEVAILEKKGRGCIVSYDKFDGENFENAYHLDLIAWKLKTKDEPHNDPWEYYNEKKKLKCKEINVYKRLKKK